MRSVSCDIKGAETQADGAYRAGACGAEGDAGGCVARRGGVLQQRGAKLGRQPHARRERRALAGRQRMQRQRGGGRRRHGARAARRAARGGCGRS